MRAVLMTAPHAGYDAAADEGRPVQGHIVIYLDQGVLVHQHPLRIAGEVEPLGDGGAAPGKAETRRLPFQAARPLGAPAGMPGKALPADATEDGQARYDVVAGPDVVDLLSNLLHDAGGLVAQDGRGDGGVQPFHVVKVAVADTASGGADYHLPRHWPVHVHLFDGQGSVDGMEHSGFHGTTSR